MTERDAAPAGAGVLHVCATPVGNLEDITLRALRILREVHIIACENTGKTRAMLARFDIRARLVSFREENRAAQAVRIAELLKQGMSVALVSEAGTPAVSDPGAYLVRHCRDEGLTVLPIPGPCALTAAFSVSGIDERSFHFAGFLPAQGGKRAAAIEEVARQHCAVVLYEAPHRLVKTLGALRSRLGERRLFLAREMTKMFEEYRETTLSRALEEYGARPPRGELVLIVEPAPKAARAAAGLPLAEEELVRRFKEYLLKGISRKDAARQLAEATGLPYRSLYTVAAKISREDAQ